MGDAATLNLVLDERNATDDHAPDVGQVTAQGLHESDNPRIPRPTRLRQRDRAGSANASASVDGGQADEGPFL